MSKITAFCLGVIVACLIIRIALSLCTDTTVVEVLEKYEYGGKCYIETWIEVTPKEYIGLDIGDDYMLGGCE